MGKWEMISFDDLIVDETRKAVKIKREDYLSNGKYQIVDQGQMQVAGYTNEECGLYTDTPVIIFGDHTRIIKYVDKPLFLGADGVKLLKTKKDCLDYKFLFYCLVKKEVPNTGYNRHFKWLKELLIPLPPLNIQKHIADTLDKTQEIIDAHKKQLEELDNLIKATFYDMFGDPVVNEKGWKVEKLSKLSLLQSGGTPSREIPEYFVGDIPWITTVALSKIFIGYEDAIEYITEEAIKNSATKIVPSNSILFGTRVGVGKVSINTVEMCTNQDIVAIINIDRKLNRTFLIETLQKFSGFFNTQKRGATIKGITSSVLKNIEIILPPLDLQNKFATIVTNIEEQKALVKQALIESQNLFNSLMSQYFD